MLKILVDAGADPNAGDSSGRTALMQASNYGNEDAVLLLNDRGAIVNQKDYNGRSALMYAANGKYVRCDPSSAGHGADVYARDLDGKTAVDLARASRNEVAAGLILSAMPDRR